MASTITHTQASVVAEPQGLLARIPAEPSMKAAIAYLTTLSSLRSEDSEWWSKVLGGHLQALFSAADYPLADQFEALRFFYNLVTPRLGASPKDPEAAWKSFMTDDHSPVEYSWKWSSDGGAPEIRYSIEPIGRRAGSSADPLNQEATCDFLARLRGGGLPGLDLEWFEHFKRGLLGPGTPASKAAAASQSTLFLAFEVGAGPVGVKAYFIPVEGPGNSAMNQISRTIASAGCPSLAAISRLHGFLRNDPLGRTVKPFMLGIDCVSPAESRIKIYSRSRATSFELVRRVMSVGGLREGVAEAEEELRRLWGLVLGLEEGFAAEGELRGNAHETAGVLFYFDVAAKAALPDVKVYIPVRHYAKSDGAAAEGLVAYLEGQGRGGYARQYLEMIEMLATKEGAGGASGVQTYISCAYKKGKLVITSYLTPQCYHPSRF
ncbi:dimethylallyl tryptophan synthase [Colletotrichum plurivorum]|uniref:Dimethylallyl tryptophan synthase n=1 Tax=Colletotrichum plurivorum TaxID=2175906 RepID=A0A8H6KNI5_9PEZI|nr:dimethylallyl tryptophan synthase [Colletotrichum plurivorum]